MGDKTERKKDLTPAFLSFQGPSLALIREPQGPLHSIIHSLVSKQERPLKAVFPPCYRSQSTSLALSFHRSATFQTCGVLVVTFYSFSFQAIAS